MSSNTLIEVYEFVVLDFPGAELGEAFLPELRRRAESQAARVVDVHVIHKAPDGTLQIPEPWDGLIGEEDVEDIVAELAPGRTAAILVLEHAGEGRARSALSAMGGRVLLATLTDWA